MLQQCHSPQVVSAPTIKLPAGGTSLMLSLYILQVDDTRTSAIHSLQLQQRQQRQQRQLSVCRGESWTVALPCPCGGRASKTHISVQPQAMHAAAGVLHFKFFLFFSFFWLKHLAHCKWLTGYISSLKYVTY